MASVYLCRAAEIEPGSVRKVDRDNGPAIAVYNIEGAYYATDDCCTHGLSSLSEGLLDGDIIECSMHFGGFHVPTGKAVLAPCSIDIKTYTVEVRGDELYATVEE
jgi:ethylbenzene dioxygenase ferredoxin subunit